MTEEPERKTPNGGLRPSWELGALAALGCAIFALFHFFGNSSEVELTSRSLFVWIARQMMVRGGDFSHSWVIPLVSMAVVWRNRERLARAAKETSATGLAVMAGSLLLHWLAWRAQQPRISLVAFVGLLWGTPLFLYGWPVARIVSFPCLYLFLGFTAYALVYFTFPLRLLSSVLAAWFLNGLGIVTHRFASVLVTGAGGFQFDVAEACSGLRSLFVMTTISAPYAYFTQPSALRGWLLFLLSIPLAILTNALRIVTIAALAEAVSPDFAMRVYHDYSGYLVFALSIVTLMACGTLIDRAHARLAAWRASR